MAEKNYVVYHLHTEDSLLDSCTNHKLYTDKAVELGQTAIAFTEHGNTYGWIAKKMYANSKGLKYIHGVECYLTESLDENIRDNYHTVLLAKNKAGIKEINSLIDLSTRPDHFYYKPRITFNEFFNISDNVIKISACLASPLSKYPSSENASKEIYEKLLKKYDYYEVQGHPCLAQMKYNNMLYIASKKYGKPLIAGTDTHSINGYKAECRSILQKSKEIMFSDEDTFDLSYKSYDELVEMFKKQGTLPERVFLEAIDNTNKMAEMIEDEPLDVSVKYPKLYDDEETVLKQRIVTKLKEKLLRGEITEEEEKQFRKDIVEEFKVFKKINMVGFMLFMSELVSWCWENNIPIGFCRGSVGGSRIAYITDIIDVNPIRWKTVFSRFANEDREEVGDIDVDISPDQRELVYKHIIESFGSDKTAYILALGTISDKGTIDEIGRALSYKWIEDTYLDDKSNFKVAKDLHKKYGNHPDNPYGLDKITQIKKEYENSPEKTKERYKELFYYFDGMLNTVVSQSIHPAGIVVSPITLPDNYGTFWSDGKRILSVDMEDVHECGLVKYDLLGLKNVQIIRKTCEYANLQYPKSYQIDWNDKKVWSDIITSPAGIFQFESDYAFELLKRFKPSTINHLSMVNASLRPSGASYRDRLLGGEINKNPSELIDDLLKDNRGFLIFQEDVIAFLQQICGLSGSAADNVRRAIGRKQIDRLQAALPQILEGYCEKSDKPREVAEEEAKTFLQIIEDASSYMFGYNHSTGYSMIGYTCGYFRYYYPEEFIAAYLNCANNTDDIVNGTNLAKLKGVTINNIKFGKSGAEYTVDKKNKAIYKGIASIKFCNAQIADELLELSKNHYDNFVQLIADINTKTSVDARQLNILTGLGFFSQFGENAYLLKIIKLCNGEKKGSKTISLALLTCKQLKKDKLESLGISDYLAKKYSEKETPKQYSGIDNIGLLSEMTTTIENKPLSIIEQIKFEKEYLEYVVYQNPKVGREYYIVTDFKTYKDATKPYLTLHRISDGEDIKTKIKQGKLFKESPFGLYSVLKVKEFTPCFKKKQINGVWTVTDETEDVLTEYEVIK